MLHTTTQFGQLFQKFDADGDGRLNSAEFEKLMCGMLEARKGSAGQDGDRGARVAVDNNAAPSVRSGARGGALSLLLASVVCY